MKILNCYAGIGGNRKNWGDEHKITAIELDPQIAKIYQDFFPNDKVIVADAHEFLEKHFRDYDFIWSSPPCPSHSRIRKVFKQNKPIYPDMKLYEEILFLKGYFKGKWLVENVKSWYEPLISPQVSASHYFWANFTIDSLKSVTRGMIGGKKQGWPSSELERLRKSRGFDLSKYSDIKEIRLLRNCVEPETGKHILDCMLKPNTLL